jgi:hypothetical protein
MLIGKLGVEHFGDKSVDGRIILKCLIKAEDLKLLENGFSWLRIA